MEILVTKLKVIIGPSEKSARDLMNSLNNPGYEVTIEQINKVIVTIEKKDVPMSLNDRKYPKDF
jgi:hypothetical protein